jgi:flagellin-specific chaperone FliS
MARQLLMANVRAMRRKVTEVLSLLNEIRSAWIAIGPQVRSTSAAGAAPTRSGETAARQGV